jgi:hypothetical protein
MIDYGSAPDEDQFEVTVFGPGYGEAVAVHLGLRRWLLVDSCMSPGGVQPATAEYLNAIGENANSVVAIVASHWHDDHVRGMSRLVQSYPQAEFFLPAVFKEKEARAFLSAYSGRGCNDLSRGTKELYESLLSRAKSVAVKSRIEVYFASGTTQFPPLKVMAFSPTEGAFGAFLANILDYVPKEDGELPITHAPEISPNLCSIVLHIDLGSEAILLGADLERHSTAGWDSIVVDPWCLLKAKARVFKVAHHGSVTGDHGDVWSKLLSQQPVVMLSPFNNGRHSLPTLNDKSRILARTKSAYITSNSSRRPRLPKEQLKRLQELASNVAPTNVAFGAVRARRKLNDADWKIELFGAATKLRTVAR